RHLIVWNLFSVSSPKRLGPGKNSPENACYSEAACEDGGRRRRWRPFAGRGPGKRSRCPPRASSFSGGKEDHVVPFDSIIPIKVVVGPGAYFRSNHRSHTL